MTKNNSIKKKLYILLPKDWSNDQRGKFWEKISASLFRREGWKTIENIRFTGMQGDIYIENEETKEKGLVECKFHIKNIESSTIFQLLGQAGHRKCRYAYLLITSDLTSDAKGIIQDRNNEKEDIKLIIWYVDKLVEKLADSFNINYPNIDNTNVKTITLILNHKEEFYWLAEEINDNGDPYRAIIFPTSSEQTIDIDQWKIDFEQHQLQWTNLEIIDGSNIDVNYPKTLQSDNINNVVISKINKGDDFEDYHRPCRPEDFIGREIIQQQFWNYIDNIKNKQTDLRNIAITGKSGLGKSSLVVKLIEDSINHNVFIYGIDVTSINQRNSAYFMTSAIRKAFQDAIDSNFIVLPNYKVVIESAEPPFFTSTSIKSCLDYLKQENKVIIIFFDQFEEILAKPELSHIFDLFQEVAFEIDCLKDDNLVLGFCWRPDLLIPMEHKAYNTWHNTEKIRKNLEIDEFEPKDIADLINHPKFNNFSKQFKKFIEDSCPRFPWLVKRICIEVYQEMIKEDELLHKSYKYIIKKIFDKDIEKIARINPNTIDCLKYIAKNAPINCIELNQYYNQDVIEILLRNRLIIQNNENYKPYWDNFSEYLISGKLPNLTISYIPRVTLSIWIKIFKTIKSKQITRKALVDLSEEKESIVKSAIIDMSNFLPIKYDREEKVIIIEDENILQLNDYQIAEYLARQFQEHIIIQKIYEYYEDKTFIHEDDFYKLLETSYAISKKNYKDYKAKMLPWFFFTGLLEKVPGKQGSYLYIIPKIKGKGKQKGKISESGFSPTQDNNGKQLKLL